MPTIYNSKVNKSLVYHDFPQWYSQCRAVKLESCAKSMRAMNTHHTDDDVCVNEDANKTPKSEPDFS